MEFGQIIELIHAVSDSNLTEFKMQDGDVKISIGTNKETKQVTVAAPFLQGQPEMMAAVQNFGMAVPPTAAGVMPTAAGNSVSSTEAQEQPVAGNTVNSPLVGTFYQSSSPESAPFVHVGDTVKKGQILGIVEAMKLMNEIESDYDGTVKEILVKNEQMVEFGQPMFVIE